MTEKHDALRDSLGEIHVVIFAAIVLPVFFSGCLISALCEPGWLRCAIVRWSIAAALILFVLADIVIDVMSYAKWLEQKQEQEKKVRNYAKMSMHFVYT